MVVKAGSPLTATWQGQLVQPPGAKDWLGLFRLGDPNTAPLARAYTNGQLGGFFTVTAPLASGRYEFRYLLEDSFTDLVRSGPVMVEANQLDVSTRLKSLKITRRKTNTSTQGFVTVNKDTVVTCNGNQAPPGAVTVTCP